MKIFIIIFDTLRKDHTGRTYGNEWIKTPSFDEFAKDCLVFDKAYPESLPTLPVRRAIHTGIRTFPFNHERPELKYDDVIEVAGWYPIPPHQKHLSEYMHDFGFINSFITSTYHQFKPNMNYHLGFDEWNWIRGHEEDKYRYCPPTKYNKIYKDHIIGRGKEPFARNYQKFMLGKYLPNVEERKTEEDYFPAQTFLEAARFVQNNKSVKKSLTVIDEFDPHEPWDPPQDYLDLYVDKNYDGVKIYLPSYSDNVSFLTEGEIKFMRASYAGEVSLCDHWFGYFMEELKNLGIYDDSLIIFISDHGHSIGDHNASGKLPRFMYPELVDIPLMIKPPGNLKGPKRIAKSYVYNHDILPTIFGFLNEEKPDVFEGADLSIFLEESDRILESRDYITCGFQICTLYKDDRYALITMNDKSQQKLFDLSRDPEWNNNIAADNADICDELFQKIEKDAKGDLLTKFESKLMDLKDWYGQSR